MFLFTECDNQRMHSHFSYCTHSEHQTLMSAQTLDFFPIFALCFSEHFSHLPHKMFAGARQYTINNTEALPNDSSCFSHVIPLWAVGLSYICSPSIIVVWRARWKAAGGERRHLQSNREEQCEISGRGSFPPCPWAGDQTMREPASDTQHLPLAPWCKRHANPPLACICQLGGGVSAVCTPTL